MSIMARSEDIHVLLTVWRKSFSPSSWHSDGNEGQSRCEKTRVDHRITFINGCLDSRSPMRVIINVLCSWGGYTLHDGLWGMMWLYMVDKTGWSRASVCINAIVSLCSFSHCRTSLKWSRGYVDVEAATSRLMNREATNMNEPRKYQLYGRFDLMPLGWYKIRNIHISCRSPIGILFSIVNYQSNYEYWKVETTFQSEKQSWFV